MRGPLGPKSLLLTQILPSFRLNGHLAWLLYSELACVPVGLNSAPHVHSEARGSRV